MPGVSTSKLASKTELPLDSPRALAPPVPRHWPLVWVVCGAIVAATVVVVMGRTGPPRDRIAFDRVPIPYHRTASHLPTIERVEVDPGSAIAGNPSHLRCVASAVDDEPNTYRWTGRFGTTGETGAADATWTPAAIGTTTITCIAHNSVGSMQSSVALTVEPAAPPP